MVHIPLSCQLPSMALACCQKCPFILGLQWLGAFVLLRWLPTLQSHQQLASRQTCQTFSIKHAETNLAWNGGSLRGLWVFFFSHAIASYDFLFCVCIFWYCISLSDWPFYLKPRLMILLAMLSRHIFLYLCYSSDMKSNWIHRLIHSLHCSLFLQSGNNNILDFNLSSTGNQMCDLGQISISRRGWNWAPCRDKSGVGFFLFSFLFFWLITLFSPSVENYLSMEAFRAFIVFCH